MTRINSGVEPYELSRQHLLAELREIKRIPNAVKNGRYSLKNIPENFKLGTGHVTFFYDKLGYLLHRYTKLRLEAVKRGYNVQDFSEAWRGCPLHLLNDWKETKQARELILQRIKERNENN